jgi:uncharacterized protein YgiM (DUF1202 family)
MKRSFALFAILYLIITCFSGAAISEELLTAHVTTEHGPLNLRSQPKNGADLMVRIPNGSVVTVLDQGDVFWEIQYNDTQGYAMCKFLTLVESDGNADSTETPSGEEEQKDVVSVDEVAGSGAFIAQVTTEVGPLNMRIQPKSGAKVLIRIPNRSLVSVIAQGDVFWEIEYGDYHGYAVCEFLTTTDYTPDILEYEVLYRGNMGDDVRAIKERLLELGYYRAGSTMNNNYNATCVARMMMFQRQNGLNENGIATAEVQAKLFSDSAVANAEELPVVKSSGYVVSSSSSSTSNIATGPLGDYDNTDWDQWMLDHPGVCPCCMGSGCMCCNYTGEI